MTTPIGASRLTATLAMQARQRVAADDETTQDAQAESAAPGVQVSFSDALRERMQAARNLGSLLRAKQGEVQEARKEAARQRIEDIKKRIKMLKTLAAGGMASKGMLRQIQQLAKELGQAASVLKEGSVDTGSTSLGNASSDASATQAIVGEAVTEAGAVEETAAVESAAVEETTDAPVAADANAAADAETQDAVRDAYAAAQPTRSDEEKQRRADAESIQEALRELKALLAIVRAAGQAGDEDSRKRVADIEKQMADIETLASDMSGGVSLSLGGISISV